MTDQKDHSIFYNPQQKRWPRTKYSMLIIISLFFLAMIAFIVTTFAGALSQNYPFPTLTHTSYTNDTGRLKTAEKFSLNSVTPSVPAAQSIASYHPKRITFLLNQTMGKSALSEQLQNVDMVIGSWLHLASGSGDIREHDLPYTMIGEASKKNPAIKFIPMLDNNLNGPMLDQMLSNSIARQRVIQFLVTYLKTNHFDGINIDLENSSEKNKSNLVLFMQELATAFRPYHFYISMDVPAHSAAFDYKQLVPSVDHMILMMYDEHWDRGKPGPIASLQWFNEQLKLRQQEIPAEKMIVGLGSYGYDWKQGTTEAEDKSFLELIEIAKKYAATIVLDPVSLNPTFKYKDTENKLHEVWFLDAVSAFNQFSTASNIRPYGFALWEMGIEDPSFWNIPMQFPLGAAAAQALQSIDFSQRLNVERKGAVLTTPKQSPVIGKREIQFDRKRNLIVAEKYIRFPIP